MCRLGVMEMDQVWGFYLEGLRQRASGTQMLEAAPCNVNKLAWRLTKSLQGGWHAPYIAPQGSSLGLA